MQNIERGVLTKNARVEIVSAMYTRMLQHQQYPSPEEYRVACRRLVEQYKKLEDKIGTGIVSY